MGEIADCQPAGDPQEVAHHLLYPKLNSSGGVTKLQMGDLIQFRRKMYRVLSVVKDKTGSVKLLSVADRMYRCKPKLLSPKSCQSLQGEPADGAAIAECLQKWIDLQDSPPQRAIQPALSSRSPRQHLKPQPFEEECKPKPTCKKVRKLPVEDLPNKKQKTTSKPPAVHRIQEVQSPSSPATKAPVESISRREVLKSPGLELKPSLELSLRMKINEQQLRALRYDFLQHQLQACQERERIEKQIYEERLNNVQNEQLLLEALAHGSRCSTEDK